MTQYAMKPPAINLRKPVIHYAPNWDQIIRECSDKTGIPADELNDGRCHGDETAKARHACIKRLAATHPRFSLNALTSMTPFDHSTIYFAMGRMTKKPSFGRRRLMKIKRANRLDPKPVIAKFNELNSIAGTARALGITSRSVRHYLSEANISPSPVTKFITVYSKGDSDLLLVALCRAHLDRIPREDRHQLLEMAGIDGSG